MEAVGFVELLAAPAAKRHWSDEAKGRMVAETLVSGVTGLFRTNPVRDSSRKSNVVAGGHEQTPPAFKTRNSPSCNEALRRRGSLTILFDPAKTREAAPTGKRGRQPGYPPCSTEFQD